MWVSGLLQSLVRLVEVHVHEFPALGDELNTQLVGTPYDGGNGVGLGDRGVPCPWVIHTQGQLTRKIFDCAPQLAVRLAETPKHQTVGGQFWD